MYPEFRVQLVDGFEVSDPFPGIGIDDSTVIGPERGVRQPGAAVTLFEDGRLLTEGIDYRFTYNTTTNELIFTPLAGVWRNGSVYEIAINNRDRFVILAPAGDAFADEDSFTITDTAGGVVFFELDSGFQIQVPQGLTMQIPLAGGAAGGVADGDRFTITSGTDVRTFEFDRNNNALSGNTPILFEYADSQEEILQAVVNAVQASGLPIVPKILPGGRIFLGSAPGTELDTNFTTISQPPTTAALKIPELGPRPGGVVDGQTFEVSDGTNTIVFEYNSTGGITAGNEPIDISTALVAEDVTNATLSALQSSTLNLSPTLVNPLLIHLGLSDNGFVDTGTSGLSAVGVARSVSDGETFTVTTPIGEQTYEFDNDQNITAGNVGISFSITDTEGEIGERVADAIVASSLGLNPVHVGGGNVAVGGTTDDNIDVSNSALGLFGKPGVLPGTRLNIFGPLLLSVPASGGAGIPENATFVLTANGVTEVFEFDSDFSGPSQPGNIVIDFDGLTTQNDLALSIAAAINASALGITATNQGGGTLSLGALQASDIVLNDSQLTISRGVVSDGEIFSISDGITTVSFEFENADLGNGFNIGNIPILFDSTSTSSSVVSSMRAAIESAGLGLLPEILPGDVLQLNDTPRFTTDVSASPTLVVTGVPGGANAVNFIRHPSFTGEDMKQAIIDAINAAENTNLIAADRGGNTLFIENAFSVSPQLTSFFLQGVADLAGNLLRPNRINNETQFTILMPGVELDYGDAPDPFTTTSGRYPTQHVNDGARHVLSTTALLGSTISSETDGQPTPLADRDDDDGVVFGTNLVTPGVFNRNVFTSVEVTLSTPGFVDAWIDFNADGDWSDPGEQILASHRFELSELTQTFQITVPATAPIPGGPTTTFARFRSSSTGGLIPTGLTVDGEVEDYAVTIVPGDPPVAVDDVYNINEDTSVITTDADGQTSPNFTTDDGIAANDTDPNGGPLAVTVLEPPQHASFFVINSDGTFTYTPDENFNGTDSFTYKVNDGVLSSNNIGTVVINIAEVNDPPSANGDTITIDEDEILDISQDALLSNDSAGPGNTEDEQTMTITSVSSVSAQGGTVVVENGRLRYTPPNDFSGFDTFTYTVTDNGTTAGAAAPLSASATVTVNVLDKNDPPIPDVENATTEEDTAVSIPIATLLDGDIVGPPNEVPNQQLQFIGVSATSTNGGTVVVVGQDVSYTPPADFVGIDTFTYTIEDNGLSGGIPDPARATGTVSVTVSPLNDAPRVDTPFGTVTMLEDAPTRVINLNDIFFDPDVVTSNDALTFSVFNNDNPSLVTPIVNGSQLELQLRADQNGQAIIVIEAEDLDQEKVQDTLTLTVTPVNDAPRLVKALENVLADEDSTPPTITLSPEFFFDPDVEFNGDQLLFSVDGNSNPLLVTPIISGNELTLQLTANQSGTAVITIRAEDSDGQAITDTFSVIVQPINDPPTTQADSYSVRQGTTLTTTDPRGLIGGPEDDGVLANDTDPESSTLTAVLVDGPTHARNFTLNGNGTFTYEHDFGAGRVTDTFTYRASDGTDESTVTTVTIVIDEPPPPTHQNPVMRLDVNADGFVSPIDALLVIAALNRRGDSSVANLPPPPPFLDVDGNNFITALDALLVIEELNTRSGGGGGEGEAAYPFHELGTVQNVFASIENRHIGMRDVKREDGLVYGPQLNAQDSIFAEAGLGAEAALADTSWLSEDETDEDETQLALDAILDSEFGEELT